MNSNRPSFRPHKEKSKTLSINNFLSHFVSKSIASLLVLLICTSVTVFAQSDSAQISGYVKDSAGAVIAGAKVIVKSQAKSIERTAVTNDQGYYVIANVPPDV